jgi:hypothetical protein
MLAAVQAIEVRYPVNAKQYSFTIDPLRAN